VCKDMKTPSRFARALQPTILTAIVLGVGGLFAAFFPWTLVAMYLAVLPLPLLLLWLSRDVATPQARIAAYDAEHTRHALA
jgi:hypothetical protein